ncbi:hypothetical protein WG66_003604, partial [Moniliophthora roreri]
KIFRPRTLIKVLPPPCFSVNQSGFNSAFFLAPWTQKAASNASKTVLSSRIVFCQRTSCLASPAGPIATLSCSRESSRALYYHLRHFSQERHGLAGGLFYPFSTTSRSHLFDIHRQLPFIPLNQAAVTRRAVSVEEPEKCPTTS